MEMVVSVVMSARSISERHVKPRVPFQAFQMIAFDAPRSHGVNCSVGLYRGRSSGDNRRERDPFSVAPFGDWAVRTGLTTRPQVGWSKLPWVMLDILNPLSCIDQDPRGFDLAAS